MVNGQFDKQVVAVADTPVAVADKQVADKQVAAVADKQVADTPVAVADKQVAVADKQVADKQVAAVADKQVADTPVAVADTPVAVAVVVAQTYSSGIDLPTLRQFAGSHIFSAFDQRTHW